MNEPMPENRNDSPAEDTLQWLAIRYVLDELTSDQIESFEGILDEDEEARREVAKAVELVLALAATGARQFYGTCQQPLPLGEVDSRSEAGEGMVFSRESSPIRDPSAPLPDPLPGGEGVRGNVPLRHSPKNWRALAATSAIDSSSEDRRHGISAPSSPLVASPTPWFFKHAGWWSAVALGIGLTAVLWGGLSMLRRDRLEVAWANDAEVLSSVAHHWAEIRRSARHSADGADESPLPDVGESFHGEEDEFGLPGWLVTAVAADESWNGEER